MSTARLHVTEERGRYHVRWFADDAGLWRAILADWRAYFGRHGDAVFCGGTKSWSVPLRARGRLQSWADHWFDPTEQVWDDEPEPERTTRGGPPPGGGQVPQSLAEAHAQLFLAPGAPLGLVESAYRWWSKELHPDRGGDTVAMARVNAAVRLIREHTEERSA